MNDNQFMGLRIRFEGGGEGELNYSLPKEVLEHVFSFIECDKDRGFVRESSSEISLVSNS